VASTPLLTGAGGLVGRRLIASGLALKLSRPPLAALWPRLALAHGPSLLSERRGENADRPESDPSKVSRAAVCGIRANATGRDPAAVAAIRREGEDPAYRRYRRRRLGGGRSEGG
jgi:hypothetical protein